MKTMHALRTEALIEAYEAVHWAIDPAGQTRSA